MKRRIPGLAKAGQQDVSIPDGEYLVQIVRAQYRWQKQKPFYSVAFSVLQPEELVGASIQGRLYCTVKALWKLSWFLRDFGYDGDLLDRDELDEKALVGLRGVVRISYSHNLNGQSFLNLEAFAPADRWQDIQQARSQQEDAEKDVA